VTFRCEDLHAALESENPADAAVARAHAASCPACASELRVADDIAGAARAMRRRWNSPALWPRIRASLAASGVDRIRPVARWIAPLAAAAVLAIAAAGWWTLTKKTPPPAAPANALLLQEHTLADVERAEGEYMRAIDRLAATAAPRIDTTESPLVLALREKLQLLDAAIAQCRAEIDQNRFNAHLRRELLAMYREKRVTLEEIINAPKSAS